MKLGGSRVVAPAFWSSSLLKHMRLPSSTNTTTITNSNFLSFHHARLEYNSNPRNQDSTFNATPCLGATIGMYWIGQLQPDHSNNFTLVARLSSPPKAVCTKSNMPSKPSHTPVPPLASSQPMVSSSQQSGRSRASCWSKTRAQRSCTS